MDYGYPDSDALSDAELSARGYKKYDIFYASTTRAADVDQWIRQNPKAPYHDCSPIHHVCHDTTRSCRPWIVVKLIRAYPKQATTFVYPYRSDRHPELPIQMVRRKYPLSESANLPIYKAFVDLDPTCLKMVDNENCQLLEGMLECYLASKSVRRRDESLEFLISCIQRAPAACFRSDVSYLHTLVLSDHHDKWGPKLVKLAKAIVERYPESNYRVRGGSSPLHTALRRQTTSLDLVLFLVETSDEELLSTTDNTGCLPLHWAMSWDFSIVQKLVTKFAPALRVKLPSVSLGSIGPGSSGDLPLHLLTRRPDVTPEMIHFIASRYPEAVSAGNDDGETPMFSVFSVPAMKALLMYDPMAMMRRDNHGAVPMTYTCFRCFRRDGIDGRKTLQEMIELCPEACMVVAKSGRTPLSQALFGGHWEAADVLIDAAPEAAKLCDRPDGIRIPALYYILEHRLCPADLLEKVVKAYPEACCMSLFGRCAIHQAIEAPSVAVCRALIRSGGVDQLKLLDTDRRFPIVLAAQQGNTEIFEELVVAAPSMLLASSRDGHGDLCIHQCIRQLLLKTPSRPYLDVLIQSAPQAVWHATNGHGDTPVHLYCTRRAFTRSQIEQLSKGRSHEAQDISALTNASGDTPFLHALLTNASEDALRDMLANWDGIASLCNEKTGEYPLHRAISRELAPQFLSLLLEAYPRASSMCNTDGMLPLHLCLSSSKHATLEHLGFTLSLLEAHEAAVTTPLPNGMHPLLLASSMGFSLDVVYRLLRCAPLGLLECCELDKNQRSSPPKRPSASTPSRTQSRRKASKKRRR